METSPKSHLDSRAAAILKGFISATEYTFATQCNLTVVAGEPRATATGVGPLDIAAVFYVDGLDQALTVAIGFEEQAYLNIVNAMLGESHSQLGPELTDSITELVNIIFGAAKRDISSNGKIAKKVIPTIILGKMDEVIPLTNGTFFHIPFESPRGDFSLQISLEDSIAMG